MSEAEIRVKVADLAVATGRTTVSTLGLGSCIAILVHAPRAQVGGLAHVLLPDESLARERGNPAKFATTAVPMLIAEMTARGARGPIIAKLVGGASMFTSLLPAGGGNMGERNARAARQALARAGVPVVAEDTGGDFGRSVYLDVSDGRVRIRALGRGEYEL